MSDHQWSQPLNSSGWSDSYLLENKKLLGNSLGRVRLHPPQIGKYLWNMRATRIWLCSLILIVFVIFAFSPISNNFDIKYTFHTLFIVMTTTFKYFCVINITKMTKYDRKNHKLVSGKIFYLVFWKEFLCIWLLLHENCVGEFWILNFFFMRKLCLILRDC